MVYHVPGQTEDSSVIEFNFFKHSARTKKSYSVDHLTNSAPRLFALTRQTSIMDVKRVILDRMRGIFAEAPADDEELNEMVQVHVRENLPMVKKGMYTRTRADCEFCGEKHAYKDELCDLQFDDVESNESVANATATTIGQILDHMKYERRLILAIVIKSAGNKVDFNMLRAKYRKHVAKGGDDSDEDKTIGGRA